MLLLSIFLYLVGIVLVVAETILPGFVMGIGGVASLILAIYLAFTENPMIAVCETMIAVVFVPVVIIWGLRRMQLKTAFNNKAGGLQDLSLVGKTAEVINDLKPYGTVLVDGKKLSATSFSEFITKGASVVIVKVEGSNIFVRKAD